MSRIELPEGWANELAADWAAADVDVPEGAEVITCTRRVHGVDKPVEYVKVPSPPGSLASAIVYLRTPRNTGALTANMVAVLLGDWSRAGTGPTRHALAERGLIGSYVSDIGHALGDADVSLSEWVTPRGVYALGALGMIVLAGGT